MQTTSGRVLNSRAVHQGQPRTKRGLYLALVGALELLSAADWNILISLLNIGLGDSGESTRQQNYYGLLTFIFPDFFLIFLFFFSRPSNDAFSN
jgi:hypothetical protein